MKTLICSEPGTLTYSHSHDPAPVKGSAIIRMKRLGVCGTDLHAYEGTQPFFAYPRILGHELAGELVDTGGAEGFNKGDLVTCIPYFSCNHCIACRSGKPNCCVNLRVCGVHIDGAMTELLSVPAYSLVHSGNLPADSLALVEPLAIGMHGVRRAAVKAEEFVLVIGAGPIGLGTMEFARIAGGQVIAMDINESRLGFCKNNLHISHIVQAGPQALEKVKEITHGDMPAVVIDATGSLNAIEQGFQFMAHGGRYVLIGLQKQEIRFSHPEFHKREATLMSSRNATRDDFSSVMEALRNKQVNPANYITHRVNFGSVADQFKTWLDPKNKVIKAMIEFD